MPLIRVRNITKCPNKSVNQRRNTKLTNTKLTIRNWILNWTFWLVNRTFSSGYVQCIYNIKLYCFLNIDLKKSESFCLLPFYYIVYYKVYGVKEYTIYCIIFQNFAIITLLEKENCVLRNDIYQIFNFLNSLAEHF